jgi:hypothetical protein
MTPEAHDVDEQLQTTEQQHPEGPAQPPMALATKPVAERASTATAGRAARAGGAMVKQAGAALGNRAVDRADNARMVAETIERTHTRQAAKAASRSQFVKERAGAIKSAAEKAATEGGRAGGREQIGGHFKEALDVKKYNATNRLTGRKLVPRKGSTNPGYDATRIIKKKFAGAVQQKSSAAGTEKAISQIEKVKPRSATRATLRVPRDHVAKTRAKAAGRIRVEGMEFTSQQAGSKLDQGLGDVARKGTSAGSKVRATAKGVAVGAAIDIALGAATEAGALKRGEITARDFAENRCVDAAEGVTNAIVGSAAAGVGGVAATAALGTATGAAAAASVGAAGTAAVGAISGMGAAGAAVGTVLGGITVAGAAPVVVGGAVMLGTGVIVGKGYKHGRRRLRTRQKQRRQLAAGSDRPELCAANLDENGMPIADADVIAPGLGTGSAERHGRIRFSAEEIGSIRQLLVALRTPRADQPGLRAKLRHFGFYLSDWGAPGGGFAADDLDVLIEQGVIHVAAGPPSAMPVQAN